MLDKNDFILYKTNLMVIAFEITKTITDDLNLNEL